jgi:hypothetical protein
MRREWKRNSVDWLGDAWKWSSWEKLRSAEDMIRWEVARQGKAKLRNVLNGEGIDMICEERI